MWNGLTDWTNLSEIGAMYPLQGFEWLMVLAAVIFWVWWHARTIRDEDQEMREAAEYYRRIGIGRAMSPDCKARKPEGS